MEDAPALSRIPDGVRTPIVFWTASHIPLLADFVWLACHVVVRDTLPFVPVPRAESSFLDMLGAAAVAASLAKCPVS